MTATPPTPPRVTIVVHDAGAPGGQYTLDVAGRLVVYLVTRGQAWDLDGHRAGKERLAYIRRAHRAVDDPLDAPPGDESLRLTGHDVDWLIAFIQDNALDTRERAERLGGILWAWYPRPFAAPSAPTAPPWEPRLSPADARWLIGLAALVLASDTRDTPHSPEEGAEG